MGVGQGSGKDKAEQAAKEAISSPLLETTIAGSMGILVSITASPDIELSDIDTASSMIAKQAHEDATVIWGVAFDSELEDQMKITIIATGFDNKNEKIVMKKRVIGENGETKTVEVIPEDLPEVGESNVPDDDINEIMEMLKKNRD